MFTPSHELGSYIPENGTLHSHRLDNLQSYMTHYKSVIFNQLSMLIAQEVIVRTDLNIN
jgi:hypothetical protein